MPGHIIAEPQTQNEFENLIADMQLVEELANNDECHGPREASVRIETVKAVKSTLDKAMADADKTMALFVVMVLENNEVVASRYGDAPALARTVMCVGEENMLLAHDVAEGVRQALAAVAKENAQEGSQNEDANHCS